MKSRNNIQIPNSKLQIPIPVIRYAGFFGICFLFIGISSCNNNTKNSTGSTSSGKEGYADTSTSTVRVFDQNGKVCIQQSNTYYQIVEAYDGPAQIPILLKIRKTELCAADSANKSKVFEISARNITGGREIHWNNSFVATDLQFNNNTMLASFEGDNDQEDYFKRYNLFDGKEIFSCSQGELTVKIPNSRDRRFIGFISRKAASNPLKDYNTENLAGVIRYSSNLKAINTLLLKLKRSKVAAKISSSTPDMILEPLNDNSSALEDGKVLVLMRADEHYQPSDVKEFAVKLTFYYGDDNETTTIVIPVTGDNLDVSNAKYDRDIFELVNQ